MESNKSEMEDKVGAPDSEEEDNVEDDAEQDPKVLLGRKIYNYNKQVDAELFRLQLKEVLEKYGTFVSPCNGILYLHLSLALTSTARNYFVQPSF